MTAGRQPYSVLNPDLEPRRIATLLRLHDPDRGVLVCHPVPPGARTGYLARDVLHALGKRPNTAGWPGRQAASVSYAKVWLGAERISDLVLLRADLFAAQALSELVAIVDGAGARTWLIFDEATRHRAASESLDARPARGVRIAPARKAERGQGPARARPWPTPSPWLARAAAAREFAPEAFNEIDLRMYAAMKATSAWISAQRQLTPSTVEHVIDVLTTDPLAEHRHARLRASIAALLQHGFAAEIHERRGPSRQRATGPTEEQAAGIRAHSNPTSAALHALALLTDLDRATLAALTLDQAIEAPQGVSIGGFLLQGAGAAALRAHLAHQRARGGALGEPLFTARALSDYRGPQGRGAARSSSRLEIKLAALGGSLDITYPQPLLRALFQTPRRDCQEDAALILRLLRLNPSRALDTKHLNDVEKRALPRLSAARAVKIHDGLVAATDHLRFSQFSTDSARYIAGRRDAWR